jgi:hypothetical protein
LKGEGSKLQATEMKRLRRAVGKTRREKIRNTYIRAELKVAETQRQIEESSLRGYGHGKRMDEHRIPKRLWK